MDDKTFERYQLGFGDGYKAGKARAVVHAKWERRSDLDTEYQVYSCSRCKERWEIIAGTPEKNQMNFCPTCGAKMDGGK